MLRLLVRQCEQTVNMGQVTDVTCFFHHCCRQAFQASLVAADHADSVFATQASQCSGEYRREAFHCATFEHYAQVVTDGFTHLPSQLCCWRVRTSTFAREDHCAVAGNKHVFVGCGLQNFRNFRTAAIHFDSAVGNNCITLDSACPYKRIRRNGAAVFQHYFVFFHFGDRNADNEVYAAFFQACFCTLNQLWREPCQNGRTCFDRVEGDIFEIDTFLLAYSLAEGQRIRRQARYPSSRRHR